MATTKSERKQTDLVRKRHGQRFRGRQAALAMVPKVERLEQLLMMSTVAEVEPNDTLALATAFKLTEDPAGSKFYTSLGTGAIGTTTDVDYWGFSAHAGDAVTISGDGGSANNSIVVELRDGSDQIIAQASDYSTGHPQISNFVLPNEGTYYVKARPYNGATLSSYDVRVDLPRGGVSGESEPNATIATASPITLVPGASGHAVGVASGNITTASDVDTFSLGSLRAGDQVDVAIPSALKPGVSTLDPKIQILNPAGAVVATASGYGLTNGTNHAKFTATIGDVYYVQVSANTAATVGPQALYLLQADVQSASTASVIGTSLPTATLANNALVFDGVNDHVTVPDSPSLRSTSVTLESWVNFSKLDSSLHEVIGKQVGTGDSDSYGLYYQNGSLLAGVGDSSGFSSFSGSFTPTVGTWYHLAFTYDSTTKIEALYVNGNLLATATTTKVIGYDANPFIIGGDTTSGVLSYPFAGRIDEVRVWNLARPRSDIQADLGRVLSGTEAGLSAYYRFEAGSGTTAADLTSNKNDGTLGGLNIAYQPSWSSGVPAVAGSTGSLSFDGVNDYALAPDSPSLRPASALTVAAWVNFSAITGGDRVIVSKPAGTGTNDSFVLYYNGGTLRASSGSTTAQATQLTYAWTPTVGTWYHVAYTYDATTGIQKLYLNGAQVATNTSQVALGYDTHPLLIGTDSNNESLAGSYFAGKIDEVNVWNVALPPATIATNRTIQLQGNESGLVAYYKLDEGSGVVAADSTSNGNTAILGNVIAARPTGTTAGAPLADLASVPTVAQAIDAFTVTFNEDPLASSANNAANYRLVEAGADGLFGTSDDKVYALTPAYAGLGTRAVTFSVAPNPLQPGFYRFQTLTGLTDRTGAAVTAYTRDFRITNPPAGVIEGTLGDDTIPGATTLPMVEFPTSGGFFTSLALGTLPTGADIDYYRFNAEAGDVVTIRLEGDGVNVYGSLYLQNASGVNQITTSSDYYGTAQIQNYTITAPGSYYIRVAGNGVGYNGDHYSLRVDQGRGVPLEVENDDTQANATSLVLGGGGGRLRRQDRGDADRRRHPGRLLPDPDPVGRQHDCRHAQPADLRLVGRGRRDAHDRKSRQLDRPGVEHQRHDQLRRPHRRDLLRPRDRVGQLRHPRSVRAECPGARLRATPRHLDHAPRIGNHLDGGDRPVHRQLLRRCPRRDGQRSDQLRPEVGRGGWHFRHQRRRRLHPRPAHHLHHGPHRNLPGDRRSAPTGQLSFHHRHRRDRPGGQRADDPLRPDFYPGEFVAVCAGESVERHGGDRHAAGLDHARFLGFVHHQHDIHDGGDQPLLRGECRPQRRRQARPGDGQLRGGHGVGAFG